MAVEVEEDRESVWVTNITEDTAIAFHEKLMWLSDKDNYKPIVIQISSYGGEVDALFSMLDTMDAVRAMYPQLKLFTAVQGKAQSAGAVLLAYGDYRFATPNSRIMVHQVISGTYGSQPENETEFTEVTRMNEKLLKVLISRCKLKKAVKDLKKELAHNLYLTADKAKEYGIVDIIGSPKVIERKVYDVQIVNGEAPPKEKKPHVNRRTNKEPVKNQSQDRPVSKRSS
jgi:ATP-dependent Clp protease protease subunit